MRSIIETYVAMATYNDTPSSNELGASPAELEYNPESERLPIWADHDGCPELRLWEDGS